MVTLTAEKTHFIFHEGRLLVQDDKDRRDCAIWAAEKYGINRDAWCRATRGFIEEGSIFFFTDEDYFPDQRVNEYIIVEVMEVYESRYDHQVYNSVYNGCAVDGELSDAGTCVPLQWWISNDKAWDSLSDGVPGI